VRSRDNSAEHELSAHPEDNAATASAEDSERRLSESKSDQPSGVSEAGRGKTDPGLARGHFESGLANQGSLRWVVADLTQILETTRRRLDLSPIAAVAFGRALTGTVLLHRIALKVPTRLQLEVLGDGPLGKVTAEVNSNGDLRGTVSNAHVPTPEAGELQIGGAVGSGLLRVTRDGENAQYSSQVELVTGELGDDLTHYLHQSEQIRSAVLLGVLPRPSGIAAAGGMIVEALPGTEDEVLGQLEARIASLGGVSQQLADGGVSGLLEQVLGGLDIEPIERRSLQYVCPCSRESLLLQLIPLAQQDIDAVIGEDGLCDAVCGFCGERYVFSANELQTRH